MQRTSWTDERLDERMTAIDEKLDRIYDELGGLRTEVSGLRGDISGWQATLAQIGFGLVGVLVAGFIAVIVAGG